MSTKQPPNMCGQMVLWMRHRVSDDDTMAHIALKYGTTMGHICRINRMHWQDIPQSRCFLWVPAERPCQNPSESRTRLLPVIFSKPAVLVPPHSYRQSVPNLDEFAGDCDPLLITTRET